MIRWWVATALLTGVTVACAQSTSFRLVRGVVTYSSSDGKEHEIAIGKRCADLWTNRDGSVAAFIAVEKERPPWGPAGESFIEESSVFIARKSDDFRPIHIAVDIELDGRRWRTAREPKVSPDYSTLYFFVPDFMTSWALIGKPLAGGEPRLIGRGTDYCVVWGGRNSGDLGILTSFEPQEPWRGVSHPCYMRASSGTMTKIADECADFERLTGQWSRERGGTCR